jgi:hypothetical protein
MFVNRISGVMVSMLALSVVGRGFKPQSGQTKDYAIGICCFSAKHTVLMRKSKANHYTTDAVHKHKHRNGC